MRRSKVAARRSLARRGEAFVAEHLQAEGYEILARNVHAGRSELDIIARRGTVLVVCEVRSRRTDKYGHPAETMTEAKRRFVRRGAMRWLQDHPQAGCRLRFDFAGLVFDQADDGPRMEYYQAAF